MAKRQGQVPAEASEKKDRALTWAEEQFVETYIDNGGNATRAYNAGWPRAGYETCRTEGCKTLAKPHIKAAIEDRREEIREATNFTREKALRILVAIATTTTDQVADAMKSPSNAKSYTGLKDKKFALSTQKTPDGWNASTPNASERRAALNDLWEKLGLGKAGSGDNWLDGIDGLLELARRVKGQK